MQNFQIIEETPDYCVESLGPSLPVLITEVLLQAERSTNISVKLDVTGWACLVCDRRLFIWRYKQTQFARTGLCYQLSLPATELCHRADLVCLMPPGGGSGLDTQMVSVLAVSPEGVVRYWPTVHREIAYSERSLELAGQECFSLTALGRHQCILATTTNQLMIISVSPSSMQCQVDVQSLKSSHGVIARMSSFLFGAQKDESSGLRRVLAGQQDASGHPLYVLQDAVLQKWYIPEPGQEQVVYEKQLDGLFKQHFQRELGASSLDSMKVWLLDIQLISNIAVLLAAAAHTSAPAPAIRTAIATLQVQAGGAVTKLDSFVMTPSAAPYQESDGDVAPDQHLLLADPGGSVCHMFSQHSILCCSGLFDPTPVFREISFSKAGNAIWGAGCFDGQAIFFSNNHGIITIRTTQTELPSFSMDESRASVQTSRLEQSLQQAPSTPSSLARSFQPLSAHRAAPTPRAAAPTPRTAPTPRGRQDASILDATTEEEDKTSGLKIAFLHSCKHDMAKAENLVHELFMQDTFERGKTNSFLDQAVARLSQELIDDFPASDPRWAESIPQDSVASTGSLILLHQLEDKLMAHEQLVKFIKDVGIWDMLHSVMVRDVAQSTHNLLSEHAEKLAAARALCNQHIKSQGLLDAAVTRALRKRKAGPLPTGLTHRDIFYREVSKIEDIIDALLEEEQDLLSTELTPHDTVSLISSVNTVLQNMLQEAWHLHQTRALVYQSHNSDDVSLPFTPWIASAGPRGIRMLLIQQHNLICSRAVVNADDGQSRSSLFQQLQTLTDLLLEGYVTQLESTIQAEGEDSLLYAELEQKYEQERKALISPFLELRQYERAAVLAEKYCDFGLLVELCESAAGHRDRLLHYMDQFSSKGFSDFVFKYYIDRGQRGRLLTHFANRPELAEFLQPHDHLGWLQDIHTNNYLQAQDTLRKLAARESLSISKKKTLLSLGKLAALASEESLEREISEINAELDIVSHHEQLPRDLIQRLNMSEEDIPCMTPQQLIELYISEKNVNSNEYDFKKALDLLQFIHKGDSHYADLRLRIWCRAILKEGWSEMQGIDPWDYFKDSVFFKTALKAYQAGLDLSECLPAPDDLLQCSELTSMRDNAQFQYLLRTGFEQIARSLATAQ